MASNSILKLQVDDKQYEASLKSAQQGLQALMDALRNSGKSFSDLDKNTEQYVRELGNMEATAKTTRGRIGEMSSTFVELSQVEKQLTNQERQSPVGKALTESLEQLKQRTIEAKQELADLDKQLTSQKVPATTGGMFSGISSKMEGALAVFGGNLMTKAASAVASLGSEIADCVKQGVELAKQGEGIRNAFDRLNRPDILDKVREATHGTVADIELMKAAVKFDDFNLNLDELGTMLAFAQQKAKDTGQSVDYMVESLVTGLGRKSLMILDNLGLSAAEIKAKMKETGDMTKAVGAIIREQMAKAGEYVETAADRAAQANVSLQNKMEELGRKFAPVEEASTQLWTSMKIAILDVVSGPLARLLNGLTEAGRLKNMIDDLNGKGANGQTHTQRVLGALSHYSGDKNDLYNRQVSRYNQMESQAWREANSLRAQLNSIKNRKGKDPAGYDQAYVDNLTRRLERAENRAKAWQVIRSDYQRGAQSILNPSAGKNNNPTAVDDEKKKTKNTKATVEKTEMQINSEQIQKLTQEYIAASAERRQAIQQEIKVLQDRNKEIQNLMNEAQGKTSPTQKLTQQNITDINESGSILGGDFMKVTSVDYKAPIEAINIELERLIALRDKAATPEEWQRLNKAINGVQKGKDKFEGKDNNNKTAKEIYDIADRVGRIGSGISSIAGGLEQMGVELPDEINKGIGFLQGITSVLTGIYTIISIKSIIPGMANGGVIGKAAGGMLIPGSSFSGDNLRMPVDWGSGMIGVNSGELILNAAQQNNIAGKLQGAGAGNVHVTGELQGEKIYLAANRYLRRSGKGELVTWK